MMMHVAQQRRDPDVDRPRREAVVGENNATTQLTWALHELAAAGAELDAAIARRMGLTAGDYLALKHLAVSSEPLGPVELGRMLGISSGAATGLVDRLEQAGYARRSPHRHDRRRQIVSTTTRAQQHMLQELQPLAEEIDRTTAHLTADQRRFMADILTDLAATHRKHAR